MRNLPKDPGYDESIWRDIHHRRRSGGRRPQRKTNFGHRRLRRPWRRDGARSGRACADALLARAEPFDLVIANAGIMACPFGHTADGFETQFGTNHLGHFALANRIASLMRPGARLVNLSSSGHRFSDVNLDDPNFETTAYEPFIGYGRSQPANNLLP